MSDPGIQRFAILTKVKDDMGLFNELMPATISFFREVANLTTLERAEAKFNYRRTCDNGILCE